jgi:ppGpp synthetase/RelA/SpoT-type nucleotidyltranferase
MTHDELSEAYRIRYSRALVPLAARLEGYIRDLLGTLSHIDRISARPKSPERFLAKASTVVGGVAKYRDPLNQIQDQIGARIVAFYTSDVDPLTVRVKDYFAPIEELSIVPETPDRFGYEGKHFVLFVPDDVITSDIPHDFIPTFFELQIRTLFQHAWGEANHDLAYKPFSDLSQDQQRKVAFTAAQAWGADLIFSELASELLPRVGV